MKRLSDRIPRATRSYWLDVPVPLAVERLRERRTKGVGDNEAFLSAASLWYEQLATGLGYQRLSGGDPVPILAERIVSDFQRDSGI